MGVIPGVGVWALGIYFNLTPFPRYIYFTPVLFYHKNASPLFAYHPFRITTLTGGPLSALTQGTELYVFCETLFFELYLFTGPY